VVRTIVALAVVSAFELARPAEPRADLVPVRYPEGTSHGFLSMKNPAGAIVASGDFIQTTRGNQVTVRLIYRFKDGSIDDDVAVFSQRGHFRLISDHHIQKGPAFEMPIETTVNVASGQVSVRYRDDHGQEKTENEQMELPPDVANGMLITLLKNVKPAALPPSVSYVAATPKPRLVKLELGVAAADRFIVAGSARRATHYIVKVKIGGIAGVVAPLIGKQPPDIHVWVLPGEAPAFVRADIPLTVEGPLFRTELASPTWR
jgi:hypothetical protein